ncbi:MAG: host attachment protein [Synechococcales cyanobacterium T60_A2020_003]|nr:host attachment protein [Synechococcales cyanobacterium T60_A2020_003]
MNKVLVAVIDSARVRFFALELGGFPEAGDGARLTELDGLLNPAAETRGEELWSSTKTGRNRGTGGQAHSYDDHREGHRAEFERRFAQEIATQITERVQAESIRNLILIAEPQVIGFMRDAIASTAPPQLHVQELAKNLSHLKTHELHKCLASHNLAPEPIRLQ